MGKGSSFIPGRLVETRRLRGMSQRSLAAAAGVSQALVAELERGKHPPSKASLDKLCAALGEQTAFFFDD
jgi:transcriptional regulator with XRE-family HTH domain